jgi:hypothetical protein
MLQNNRPFGRLKMAAAARQAVLAEMNEAPPEKLRIEYIKSNFFRIVHADGAIGGTSPRLELFITFYSERFPIPKVLVYQKTPEGSPGEELTAERESKAGIIREAEVGVTLDLPTAKSLAVWLNEKIAELEKARERVILSNRREGEEVKG